MSKYFSYIPKFNYSIDDTNAVKFVTNIVSSPSIEPSFIENTSVYYTYEIRDGDTPDNLAAKFYGSSERYWIILMMNNIVDPQYDWPLKYDEFNRYVDIKYYGVDHANSYVPGEGLQWAKNSDINRKQHSYYKVITKTVNDVTTVVKLPVDKTTYDNDEIMQTGITSSLLLKDGSLLTYEYSKEYKTFYDYEYELNESKREIKILKQEFVSILENEIKEVYQ